MSFHDLHLPHSRSVGKLGFFPTICVITTSINGTFNGGVAPLIILILGVFFLPLFNPSKNTIVAAIPSHFWPGV